jgi:hypothetical protein
VLEQRDEMNANQLCAPKILVYMVDFVCHLDMEFNVSVQLDFQENVAISTLTNVLLSHVSMAVRV